MPKWLEDFWYEGNDRSSSNIGPKNQVVIRLTYVHHSVTTIHPVFVQGPSHWKDVMRFIPRNIPNAIKHCSFLAHYVAWISTEWSSQDLDTWLGSPPFFMPWKGQGNNPILTGLTITMVINHLQVMGWSSKYDPDGWIVFKPHSLWDRGPILAGPTRVFWQQRWILFWSWHARMQGVSLSLSLSLWLWLLLLLLLGPIHPNTFWGGKCESLNIPWVSV